MAEAGDKLEEEIAKVKNAVENRILELRKVGDYQLDSIEGTVEFKGTPFGIGVDGTLKLTYSLPKAQAPSP
jgi:hypothetical protein